MSVVYAVFASLLFGTADYMGGNATRRASAWVVLVYSQLFGIVLGVGAAILLPFTAVSGADLFFGGLAGLGGALGLGMLYYSLAHTVVSVASPTAAVVGAAIPLVFGVAVGESTSLLGFTGIALALVSIVLVSGEGEAAGRSEHVPEERSEAPQQQRYPDRRKRAVRAVIYGTIAGIGFGGFFVAISRTSESSGLWPLVAARTLSIAAVVVLQLVRGGGLRLPAQARPASIGAGLLDMAANIAYLLAVRSGLIMVVTLITSTYPAGTVALARIIDREHLTIRRAVGLITAIVAVAMIGVAEL